MEEKDDFDVFMEKADQVVRRWEAGEDIDEEREKLLQEGLRIDPSTIPSPSVEPVIVCKVLANLRCSRRLPIFPDLQSPGKAKPHNENKILKNSSLKSNQSFYFRLSITALIAALLVLYYLNSPRPCPRPIW